MMLLLFLAALFAQETAVPVRRTLEAEPSAGPKPADWEKSVTRLSTAIDARDSEGTAATAAQVAAWDSPESANKLISMFLRCVRLLETGEAQEQKLTKGLDDVLIKFVIAYYTNPGSSETAGRAKQYKELSKQQEELIDRLYSLDVMVEEILKAVSTLRTKEAAAQVYKQSQGSFSLRYRARMVEALGPMRTATAVSALIEILGRKEIKEIETLSAIRAIRVAGVPTAEAVGALARALDSEYRQIRFSAAAALAGMGCRDQAGAIIDALGKSTGQPAWDLNEALTALTGVDKHANAVAWKAWWERNREAFITGAYVPEAMEKAGAAGSTTFYGIPVTSRAVAFVVDISGSMSEPAEWKPGADDEGSVLGIRLEGGTRMDVLKYEMKRVLTKLPDDAVVTLVFFDGNLHIYGGGAVRLTSSRRKSLIEFVANVKGGGLTNMWGATAKALTYAGDASVPSLKKDGIDTIFALTDGEPTVGIQDPVRFTRRFQFLNRYSHVRVHTLHIGTDPKAGALLEMLSKASGGTYTNR